MQGQLTNNHVELRAVHTLLGKRYYIPSYQRGYRWTTKQVTQLLDDLLEFERKKKKRRVLLLATYCCCTTSRRAAPSAVA